MRDEECVSADLSSSNLARVSLAYGPNVYFLTRYIGRLRAALVATAASDQLAEHEKLMQHGGEEVAKEVKKTMAFLLVINVKKSPFFVDAEEDSYEPLADVLVCVSVVGATRF